jgi:hypothetical protein
MIWYMLFCAWGIKAGGCQTPVPFKSKAACEFVLRHQRDLASATSNQADVDARGRCVGVPA